MRDSESRALCGIIAGSTTDNDEEDRVVKYVLAKKGVVNFETRWVGPCSKH
jgi:hypothetical protein